MKSVNNEQYEKIETDLFSKKSAKRRASAKKIRKLQLFEFKDNLFEAYIKEIKDSRTWETQVEMIRTLVVLKEIRSIPYLKNIIEENEMYSMLTMVASEAYVRLNRKGENDLQPLIILIKQGNFSVLNGALSTLEDSSSPAVADIEEIVNILTIRKISIEKWHDVGLASPWEFFLLASLNWKIDSLKLNNFIEMCLHFESVKSNSYFVTKYTHMKTKKR